MGLRLCIDLAGKLDKFEYVDSSVDDMKDKNPGVRLKPPAKIVKTDMVDDGDDDQDTQDRSYRIIKAAKTRERLMVKTVNHLRVTRGPVLPKPNERSAIKPTVKSWCQKSLAEKMAERRNNPNPRNEFTVEGVKGEREAKSYMNALQKNSAAQITETFETLESMIQKETDTLVELKRQGKVVKQANRDILAAEKDISDTNYRLKGMQSVGNKLANIIFGKPSSAPIYVSDDELDIGYRRSSSTPIKLPSRVGSKSEWINDGIDQLCHLLDIVEHKEIELGYELEKEEEAMNRLDQNMDHIEEKITNQSKLMKSMTRN